MLYAFREESGLADNTALKIVCGLGAGMGRKEEVCGAVTGGIIVIQLSLLIAAQGQALFVITETVPSAEKFPKATEVGFTK